MPFESRAWQLTDNSINASSFKYLVTNAKQETPLGLVFGNFWYSSSNLLDF